jgi:Na+/H+-translocating membrane pyrophosphatase
MAVVLLVLSTVTLAFYLGDSSDLAGGGLLGVALAVGGLLGSAPYVLAMDGLGSMADTAGGVIEMTVAAERPDVRARARLLDAVGTTAKSYTRSVAAVASSLASLVLLAVFQVRVWSQDEAASGSADASSPLLYIAAILGLLVILSFHWATLRRIVSAARELVNELRVQLGAADPAAGLRGTPHAPFQGAGLGQLDPPAQAELGDGQLGDSTAHDSTAHDSAAHDSAAHDSAAHDAPLWDDLGDLERGLGPGRLPSPRRSVAAQGESQHAQRQLACVEIVARIALRGMLAPALVGLILPIVIGVALRLSARGDSVTGSAEALVALLLVATIAGALGSLLFTTAGSAWDNAKKYIETGAHGGRYVLDTASQSAAPAGRPRSSEPPRPAEIDNPTYVAAVIGDTIGDPLKGAVGPATQALLETLIALTLVFLPFFF